MNKHFLDKRRNVFLLAAFAVFMESLTSPCLKIGSQRYETFSIGYFFCFGLAVVILGIYYAGRKISSSTLRRRLRDR